MTHWPRPLDDLDRRLGADPVEEARGLLACFLPRLPAQGDVDAALWDALRIRADERSREWKGPIGDRVRAFEGSGVIRIDPWSGLLRDPATGQALDRAQAELLVLRAESSPARIARSNTAVDGSGSTPSSASAE